MHTHAYTHGSNSILYSLFYIDIIENGLAYGLKDLFSYHLIHLKVDSPVLSTGCYLSSMNTKTHINSTGLLLIFNDWHVKQTEDLVTQTWIF